MPRRAWVRSLRPLAAALRGRQMVLSKNAMLHRNGTLLALYVRTQKTLICLF
jgi:hypothetical protein